MVIFQYNLYIFVWIKHGCLTNTVYAKDPNSSVIKRLWCIQFTQILSLIHVCLGTCKKWQKNHHVYPVSLMLSILGSADGILKYFSYFSQKTGFDVSCKLSPLETICMGCQICFLRKIRKISPICHLPN